MLPTATQFFHMFEDHVHVTCTEQKTHVHSSKLECEICTFTLSTFSYSVASFFEIKNQTVQKEYNFKDASILVSSYKFANKQLRAPPIYS